MSSPQAEALLDAFSPQPTRCLQQALERTLKSAGAKRSRPAAGEGAAGGIRKLPRGGGEPASEPGAERSTARVRRPVVPHWDARAQLEGVSALADAPPEPERRGRSAGEGREGREGTGCEGTGVGGGKGAEAKGRPPARGAASTSLVGPASGSRLSAAQTAAALPLGWAAAVAFDVLWSCEEMAVGACEAFELFEKHAVVARAAEEEEMCRAQLAARFVLAVQELSLVGFCKVGSRSRRGVLQKLL
jgi:hypothetical protein